MSSGPVGNDPLFFAVGGRRSWPDPICQRRGRYQVSTGETETARPWGGGLGIGSEGQEVCQVYEVRRLHVLSYHSTRRKKPKAKGSPPLHLGRLRPARASSWSRRTKVSHAHDTHDYMLQLGETDCTHTGRGCIRTAKARRRATTATASIRPRIVNFTRSERMAGSSGNPAGRPDLEFISGSLPLKSLQANGLTPVFCSNATHAPLGRKGPSTLRPWLTPVVVNPSDF